MPSATFPIPPDNRPLIELTVRLTEREAVERRRAGQPVPEPIRVVALVSTGTARTGFGPDAFAALKLEPADLANIMTAPEELRSEKPEPRTYRLDIAVLLPTGKELLVGELEVAELAHCSFQQHGYHGVLGRDVLNRYSFRSNGPTGQFTLEWSDAAGIPDGSAVPPSPTCCRPRG